MLGVPFVNSKTFRWLSLDESFGTGGFIGSLYLDLPAEFCEKKAEFDFNIDFFGCVSI